MASFFSFTAQTLAVVVIPDPFEGKTLTKLFDGSASGDLWLAYSEAMAESRDVEAALSRMTRWVLDCEEREIRYGLRMPGVEIAPDRGAAHRAICLKALAMHAL